MRYFPIQIFQPCCCTQRYHILDETVRTARLFFENLSSEMFSLESVNLPKNQINFQRV